MVFRGLFFTPKLPLNQIFDLESHLGAQLATASVANKSKLVLARSVRPNPDFYNLYCLCLCLL